MKFQYMFLGEGKCCTHGEIERQNYLSQREFNQINKVIWEATKHILGSLEDDNDDSNLEVFYTSPKNLS
jgi:hypothetical protein